MMTTTTKRVLSLKNKKEAYKEKGIVV